MRHICLHYEHPVEITHSQGFHDNGASTETASSWDTVRHLQALTSSRLCIFFFDTLTMDLETLQARRKFVLPSVRKNHALPSRWVFHLGEHLLHPSKATRPHWLRRSLLQHDRLRIRTWMAVEIHLGEGDLIVTAFGGLRRLVDVILDGNG